MRRLLLALAAPLVPGVATIRLHRRIVNSFARRSLAAVAAWMFLAPGALAAERGVVVFENRDCIVIDTGMGLVLAEWYGDGITYEGQQIVDNLHSYGFENIITLPNGGDIRVWIEDYLVSERSAIKWIREEHCD